MSTARIRFSTEILKRLGEELNPSLDKGVLELVKNAYDADATKCKVELQSTDAAGGVVIVKDNGNGMSTDDITNGWLVLGKSTKTQQRKTRLGRIPAGSKGLGRLAALRMGKRALMTTFPRKEKTTEHGLLIDWEEFDTADLVDDVELSVETARRKKGTQSGTEIRIEELRTGFSRTDVKRLARELILLADPFGADPEGFRPELVAPEYEDIEALVRSRYFQDAEYHLRAEIDKNGQASAHIVDWKGQGLHVASHEDVSVHRAGKAYKSPPATFDLWVFILNKETFSTRRSSVREVQEWLREFGGVHFYYNGLRVSPYGNPGNDWLEMNLRRVRSPEERPGTNTSIGRIDVTDRRGRLVQKTDRSGFIEDESFIELRLFAQDAMEWMANRRMEEAEKRRSRKRTSAPRRVDTARRGVEAAIAKAPSKSHKAIRQAFATYESARDREVDLLQKEIQLYRTLSTAGITAVTFAHESSGNPVKVVSQSVEAIARRAQKLLKDDYSKLLQQPVDGIRRAVRSLAVLGAATLKLVDHEKRRVSRVDLHELLQEVLDTYDPFLKGRDVTVQTDFCAGNPYLRGSDAAIESILTNLLNNSLAAFESGGTRDRVVRISTSIALDRWTLMVHDSGPGIQGIRKADIWLPGLTTRKNGTGLGLTIVRDAVKDLGGEVDAIERGELGGAVITVELPILGE
ncbi:MAG: sensor histidine kinase [Gemmatimonadetes bacterium]|nr:sensor histidine kinase [Gemmatimonadota bacterium]